MTSILKKAMAENLSAIEELRVKSAEFELKEPLDLLIERALEGASSALAGDGELPVGYERCWAHMDPAPLLETAILPPGRDTVPVVLSPIVYGREMVGIDVLVDAHHPAADLTSDWRRFGSRTHGLEVKVVRSRETGRGFDLTRSRWPEGLPINYATLRRVVDKIGEVADCCGSFPKFSEEEIKAVFA